MSDFNVRRDPRIEWIARNRLHPLHASVNANMGDVRGPTGLIRKNVHAVGFIGPNGIKRIDRLAGNSAMSLIKRAASQSSATVERPLHCVESPDFYITTVLDTVGGRLTEHDKDVLGQAHKLSQEIEGNGAVVAVVFGSIKEEAFDKAGVDRLIHIEGAEYEGYNPEQNLIALTEIEKQLSPKFWLFPDSASGGRELGSRLSAKLDIRSATQVLEASVSACICRGNSNRTDITRATPRLLLLAEESALQIDQTRHQVSVITIDQLTNAMPRIKDKGQLEVDSNEIPLAEAEFILSAGNGIHNWEQFHEAARVLGATEGASRVAVDDGFMPRERQVGATGTWVTARVYLAVGISGAVQHMQGIEQCGKKIAINTDAGCSMVKSADLSVIGDSHDILTELMHLVQSKGEKGESNAA